MQLDVSFSFQIQDNLERCYIHFKMNKIKMSFNRHVRYIARIGQSLVLAVNESDKAFQPDKPGRVQLRVVQGHLY